MEEGSYSYYFSAVTKTWMNRSSFKDCLARASGR